MSGPKPPWAEQRTQPGDQVLIRGIALMDGVGHQDDHTMVQVAGNQFVRVPDTALISATPQPLPDHLAVVHKADLRTILPRVEQQKTLSGVEQDAVRNLRAQVPPDPDVRQGDVWRGSNGVRWFASKSGSGGLRLFSENAPDASMHPCDAAAAGLELEWRRPDGG